jgi:hypothetical protein
VYDPNLTDASPQGDYRVFKFGQVVESQIELPAAPENQRDAQRIVVSVDIEPAIINEGGKRRPADPWTRLGTVTCVLPDLKDGPNATPAQPPGPQEPQQLELIRFITSFGGAGTFSQDVTSLAPLLQGKLTIRASIGTISKPAWKISVKFHYTAEGVGNRRPAWAKPLFRNEFVTADKNVLRATVEVAKGVAMPRLWITSTGHASDGTGANEFISCTHVLKIDGREVARWRPWTEDGGSLRDINPMSGRETIDGRELWSSDLDRSGWSPGRVVEPVRIPVPELTPGKHTLELQILAIRPKDEKGQGYWRTSAVAVADESWPSDHPTQR